MNNEEYHYHAVRAERMTDQDLAVAVAEVNKKLEYWDSFDDSPYTINLRSERMALRDERNNR